MFCVATNRSPIQMRAPFDEQLQNGQVALNNTYLNGQEFGWFSRGEKTN
jgi:hypothetical protein